ncbi:phosphatidylinositol 5-phosphate 4-kinase type-2 alpha [Parasteatoda tepidariorum]|uniref:1-phosphatidylinositol-5-phosphate 4-kinase n=1 Tax=Parasteatoda tepidariorum TaxID=114398 RepID=A0A2L2YQC5_PARTP|nr:phosphatidylinositol 5-phosphate 4-kinase type-2 alpha [Parasteatoda tepidariorum]
MSTNIVDIIGSKVKKKHFKPKHQKAKVFRANEPLLSVFMWGVNHTISGLTHVNVPIMLMPDDFKAFSKVKVDNHCFNKENMPSHFKVKEYCPLVFRNLRERFGINETDYINSLTKSQPIPIDSDKSKLYESWDKLFVVKSLQSEEIEFMHTLLKHYHPYIVEKHGKTLLPQYLGLYRVTVEGNETYLVVMRNIFSGTTKIHCKYDIKGTSVDREASAKEKTKEMPTLKDGDFINDGCKLYVGPEHKEKLLAMLSADTDFLASRVHLTDYSVCLGIHDCEADEEDSKDSDIEEEEEGSEDSTTVVPTPPESPRIITFMEDSKEFKLPVDPYAFRSSEDSPRKELYFIGLVEILSHYGTRKRTATINSTQPEHYARHLVDFMAKAML